MTAQPDLDGVREISLLRGQIALVDEQDYERISAYRWLVSANGYAVRACFIAGKRVFLLMHREVLGLPNASQANNRKGNVVQVDHIDGNKLNNVRANLRPCTPSQNQGNRKKVVRVDGAITSCYKGVRRSEPGKWVARILVDGRTRHLGTFVDEIAAAKAYDAAALAHWGRFAKTNFLGNTEGV